MIARVEDVRKIRAVAQNVADCDIERFIEDAELQDVLPIIGAEKYFAVDKSPCDYDEILKGGTFTSKSGELCYSRGLTTAIAYLTYSRMLLFGDIQITASGAVKKALQNSSNPSEQDRSTAADGARKIGLSILNNVAKMLSIGESKCQPRRKIAVGGVIKKEML